MEMKKVLTLDQMKSLLERIETHMVSFASDSEIDDIFDEVFKNRINNGNNSAEDDSNAPKYTIRKDGADIDHITLNSLISKIKNNTVLTDYGWGSQLIVKYTDAATSDEYDLPFNFGTYQEFEKEDGTKFNGLGLVAEYALPIEGIQFDNNEPSNTNSDRRSKGNNRWKHSNVRQWLNKKGNNWYEAYHSYDNPPTIPNPATTTGFLSCLPDDFVNKVVPVKVVTRTCITPDNAVIDNTFDKFFILSMSQVNCKITNTEMGMNSEKEGRYWEYWRNRNGVEDYLVGNDNTNGGLSYNDTRIVYNIENTSIKAKWWLRSAVLNTSYRTWRVYDNGCISIYPECYDTIRVVPACVIG